MHSGFSSSPLYLQIERNYVNSGEKLQSQVQHPVIKNCEDNIFSLGRSINQQSCYIKHRAFWARPRLSATFIPSRKRLGTWKMLLEALHFP